MSYLEVEWCWQGTFVEREQNDNNKKGLQNSFLLRKFDGFEKKEREFFFLNTIEIEKRMMITAK